MAYIPWSENTASGRSARVVARSGHMPVVRSGWLCPGKVGRLPFGGGVARPVLLVGSEADTSDAPKERVIPLTLSSLVHGAGGG